MANPGNAGHKGYKLALVTSIEAKEGNVIVHLACGHDDIGKPYEGYTVEAWAKRLQEGHRPIIVGKTRLRCEKQHKEN